MGMGMMPLYPPMGGDCERESCVRLPLFQRDNPPQRRPCGACQTVRLENPYCPGECAEVTLSVDSCGCLAISIHREPPVCGCGPKPRERRCW